ncbi:zinc transporter ZIP3-like isoform X2 [Tigriopus californicus]|uniref:zinc transporter ZIP3-like isoform X2 n=1 Tax=Tigriopus californicus TaxID=6832 RepID=UPI0027DA1717|nr:zinc transporter ZIP3-like isoform X2 [Tigriopus californicus]
MEHLTTVFVTTALAVILSLVFSGIPFLFTKSCLNLNPEHPNHNKLHRNNVILSFLLNLGGGVLIANCFCHWLPEVRAAFGGHGIGDEWPLAEIILCLGFFLVRFLEEVIQSCAQNTPHGHSHRGYPESEQQVRMVNTTSDDLGPRECTPIRPKRSVVSPQSCDPQPVNDILEKQSEHIFVSTIRTVFAIVALSFHSVIEGLALSYESDETGIWMNFGALALHKFVIAFSIGVELMTSQLWDHLLVSSWLTVVLRTLLSEILFFKSFKEWLLELSFMLSSSRYFQKPKILEEVAFNTWVP